MADKITDFLNDISLQNSSRGTWGIGTVIARAGAKAAQAIMRITVKSAEDQGTKSLRSSPLCGGKNRETGSRG